MAGRKSLLTKVEKLLDGLLNEAQEVHPAVFDTDGIETSPARVGATFGERLKLAEVVTVFETRRAKLEEDEGVSGIEEIARSYQGHGSGTSESRARRKTRAPESNGVANAGRVLTAYGTATDAGLGGTG